MNRWDEKRLAIVVPPHASTRALPAVTSVRAAHEPHFARNNVGSGYVDIGVVNADGRLIC